MDGLELICGLPSWQEQLGQHFYPSKAKKNIVVHDIGLCHSMVVHLNFTMIMMNSLSFVWTSLLVVEGHKVRVVNS